MNNKKRVFRIFLLASFIASETLLIDVKSDAMKKGNIIKQIHNINDTTILDYERFKWYGKIDSESEQSSFVDAKKLLKERYGCENFYCYQHAPFFLLVGLNQCCYIFYPLNEKKISEEEAKGIQSNIKANLASIKPSILPKNDSILRPNLFARKNMKMGKNEDGGTVAAIESGTFKTQIKVAPEHHLSPNIITQWKDEDNGNDKVILDFETFEQHSVFKTYKEVVLNAKKLLKERYGCRNFYCYQHAPFFLLVGLDRYFYVFYPLNEKKISEEEAKNIQNNIKANLSSINFSILPKRDSILRLNLFARKNIKIGKKMLRIPIIDQTRKMPIFEDDLDDSFSFELIDGSDNESITMSTSTIKKNGSNDELSTMSTSTVKRNSDKDQSKQAINWQSPPRLLLKLENGKLNISLDINSNINQDDTYKTPLNNGKDSPENTVRRQPKKFLRKNKKNLTLEI